MREVLDALRSRRRFVVASHARPDGDAVGSQLALTHALRQLGKAALAVSRDPLPPYCQSLPGASEVSITSHVDGEFDAAVVLECGSLARTELAGLDRYLVINVDHHMGNTNYGAVNWFDETAAACGEMVFDIVQGLGVPLTDRDCELSQGSVGKLRLTGALLSGMELQGDGRVAVLQVDDRMLRESGCTADDLEGLINLPLAAADVQAVLLFKDFEGQLRVSVRSKRSIDVRAVAVAYGGGGHRNASGFSVQRPLDAARRRVVADVTAAVDAGSP
ncbi:Bifunctional oligoribonuclease and PAP phosphatase NrnA [Geodia barretti]|uniref:Bifunctional oligoribonuclease and PAP phosphatase NrnA n=1 Tax=Geodia barretti TaxID=519541 RepID=A0AA35W769_GEOBA|nr:Bifunctional oligoribonuclease and PAP phosphatase NrnA [Geodia barretti]